jgi:hypothetical protein
VPDTDIERPDDLTAEWLTAALGEGAVADFDTQRIGTGQMSECYRVALRYADGQSGPASVVLKVAATDPASRQTGLALGLYEREVRFYTDIAPRIDGPVAPCYSSDFDGATGVFHLLLGDAAPAVAGDEIRGASVDQAMVAMRELGRLHAPLLGQTAMAEVEWLNRESPMNQALIGQLYAGFADRYGDLIAPAHREVCERLVAGFDAFMEQEAAADRVNGLVHGDYRLDNMLFGEEGADRPLTVVDWQTVTWGPAMIDVAYFLGCAVPDDVRRGNYDALLAEYHAALGPDTVLGLDDVREGVRRQSFFGVMMAIVSSMLVERTDRGDEMFMTMLRRHSQHVLDTDALATLPAPAAPDPLCPSADDEGAHPPGVEPLWSESWYADFVDEGQSIGGWFRLGLMPNENIAWVNALLCGPGMPTVAVNDFEVALPADPAEVHTTTIELTHGATEPLQAYRVRLTGSGRAYDDPAALLRDEPGRPVDVSMDLLWTTVGTPYQYRLTPRYEIPCTVSGTVAFGDVTVEVSDVAGQRDHSWGVRDWWSMEWVWSALHLHDGTHLHGVDLRIPGAPPMGVGYVQPPGAPLIELGSVTATEEFGADELPVATALRLGPAGMTADVRIMGHAPVLLTSVDGRVSNFPRAWATVTTGDGRTGVGWLEWNRNKR